MHSISKKLNVISIFIFIFSLQICSPVSLSSQTNTFYQISWFDPIHLSQPNAAYFHPSIVVDNYNKTSVIWSGTFELKTAVSYCFKNDTSDWSVIEDVSTTPGIYSAVEECSLILDNHNMIHISWKYSNNDLYYRYYNGSTWSESHFVSVLDSSSSFSFTSFMNGSIIFIWNAISASTYQVFSRCFYPQFNNWSDVLQITTSTSNCFDPDITIDSDDNAHLVWVEEKATPYFSGVKYQTFTSNYTFSNETKLSNLDDEQYDNPCIITDSLNNAHVVWEEKIGFPSYERGLVYKSKINDSWSSKTYFDLYGNARNPVIVCDSNDLLHLLWSEYSSLIYNQIGKNRESSGSNIIVSNCGETKPDLFVDNYNKVHVVYYADESASEPSYYGINYLLGIKYIEDPTPSVSISISFQTIFFISLITGSAISVIVFKYKKKELD